MGDEMTTLESVLRSALGLDVADRAALAEKLLASLDQLSEEEAKRLWAEESRRRLDAYRAGRASSSAAEDVFRKADTLLG
jgi:putative addiction module component (TIGR02574 family)